jgi:peroxiredoxin
MPRDAADAPDGPSAIIDEATPELREWRGEPLSNFALPDLAGVRHALTDQVGRPVLVHFFATWCEPCRPELIALERVATREPTALRILAISVNEPEGRVRRFFHTLPVSFPVLLDPDRAIARAWSVETIPTSFLLDADLNPRLFVKGDLAWDRLDMARILGNLPARDRARETTSR